MKQLIIIVKADYLQYIRSYSFLLTLAIALYAAYTFVPPPGAIYTTVTLGDFTGVNNSAWCGYSTAMMTSVFLSVSGFFLVNGTIRRDIESGVGMIIATTPIRNRQYLLSKVCSNFLVLLTITGVILVMSIAVFLVRPTVYPFEAVQFILPFLVITVPAIFFTSCLAVLAEIFLYRYSIVGSIAFFIFLMFSLAHQQTIDPHADFLGVKSVMLALQSNMELLHPGKGTLPSMGYMFNSRKVYHTFEFQGIWWSASIILSRLLWMGSGIAVILFSARFFHRFDISPPVKKQSVIKIVPVTPQTITREIRMAGLPSVVRNFSILLLLKTECMLLLRRGPRWMWLLNFGGMAAMIFAPLPLAHQYILPCLWFLQVIRWSDLPTKEKTNQIHYFSYAAYKPLTRLFLAQIIAGVLVSTFLAAPLVIRLLLQMQYLSAATVVTGSVFIVLTAVVLGMVSGGKKLFEILFFLCTYGNLNNVPATDYFGGINHNFRFLVIMLLVTTCLFSISFIWRKWEMSRM